MDAKSAFRVLTDDCKKLKKKFLKKTCFIDFESTLKKSKPEAICATKMSPSGAL